MCSINLRGKARGTDTPYMPPRETLAATSSQLNSEVLVVRMVLAHPRVTFYPCTCGLCGDVAALIGYNDTEVAVGMTMRRR
jgi:hypothetical protein